MKKLILLSAIVALSACAKKVTDSGKTTNATTAAAKPVLSADELARGKDLSARYCGSCHAPKNAEEFTTERLGKVVPDMVRKVNKKAGSEVLSMADSQLITKFYQANAGH